MGAEHKETQYLKVIFSLISRTVKEISKGFGHFDIINIQETVVQPVFCKRFAVGRLALSNFIFMMRENQVFAAGMDINFVTEIFLDMTEHSMCQPGRPSPHGVSRKVRLLFRFQRTKSIGSSLLIADSNTDACG